MFESKKLHNASGRHLTLLQAHCWYKKNVHYFSIKSSPSDWLSGDASNCRAEVS